jgi:hypothetical protein
MSSCSEYLVRQQLRTQKYIDTRPHMTCGQATEIVRQQAGSTVYEQFLPATACVSTLNGPSTRGESSQTVARGHRVKDASAYVSYASAGATAQALNSANVKPPQIKDLCYGVDANGVNQIREVNDTILLSTLLSPTDPNYYREATIAKARQSINNCCTSCGKVNFASACACAGLSPGLTNPLTGGPMWKNTYIYPRTVT